jgi:hypothetical protein
MDGRSELLAFMGAATVTVVGLFTLQIWYGSYLDVSLHDQWNGAPMSEKLQAERAKEAQALQGGSMPIDKAMSTLAERGRRGFPQLAPQQSNDLGAMSGWINLPGFSPYTPREAVAPVEAIEQPAVPAEGEDAATVAGGGSEAEALAEGEGEATGPEAEGEAEAPAEDEGEPVAPPPAEAAEGGAPAEGSE